MDRAADRIEQAKQLLREKLTYERIKRIPKYAQLTRKQYETLIAGIESVCLLLLENFTRTNKL